MIFPFNGRVIVIDDDETEAIPLIKALSKEGISYKYFSGLDETELPESPITAVRLVFLDIVLGTGGQNEKTKITKAVNVLNRILGTKDVEPYILIAWTKENRFINKIENSLISKPIMSIDLEKSDCKDLDTGDFVINKIITKLKEKLSNFTSFQLIMLWENLVNKTSGKFIQQFLNFLNFDDEWDSNFKQLLYRMAISNLGQNITNIGNEELIRNSLQIFNKSFICTLENETQNIPFSRYLEIPPMGDLLVLVKGNDTFKITFQDNTYILSKNGVAVIKGKKNKPFNVLISKLSEKNSDLSIIQSCGLFQKAEKEKLKSFIDNNKLINSDEDKELFNSFKIERAIFQEVCGKFEAIKAKINTNLFIELQPVNHIRPGNLYINDPEDIRTKTNYLSNYFSKKFIDELDGQKLSDIRLVELEVSPSCDYAQKKWKFNRFLCGVMYPNEIYNQINDPEADHYYHLGTFALTNDNYRVTFDFRLFKTKKLIRVQKKLCFAIKAELLSDIITRLSSHITRIGVAAIE